MRRLFSLEAWISRFPGRLQIRYRLARTHGSAGSAPAGGPATAAVISCGRDLFRKPSSPPQANRLTGK